MAWCLSGRKPHGPMPFLIQQRKTLYLNDTVICALVSASIQRCSTHNSQKKIWSRIWILALLKWNVWYFGVFFRKKYDLTHMARLVIFSTNALMALFWSEDIGITKPRFKFVGMQEVCAPTYLQPHYDNGVFSNVYLLALGNTTR